MRATLRHKVRHGLKTAAAYPKTLARGGVVVLLYHRIARFSPDPQRLCVHPELFAEQLDAITKRYTIVSTEELEHGLRVQRVPRGAVALTFDDGYADNYKLGYPLIRERRAPATVFVATGNIDTNEASTTDQLEALLLASPRVPDSIQVRIREQRYDWELWNSAARPADWHVESGDIPSGRHQCYVELHRLMRTLAHEERMAVLADLRKQIPAAEAPAHDRRVLSRSELQELALGGLVRIGGHTVNHLSLAHQTPDVQRKEVAESKRSLESILQREITAFAYPYGGSSAVSGRTCEIVRESGFGMGFDNVPGVVRTGADPLRLPRFLVRNWTGVELAARLKEWFVY